MGRLNNLMCLGVHGVQAEQMTVGPHKAHSALTAAGSDRAGATAIEKPICVVGTTASSTGVALTSELENDLVIVKNSGANTLSIYPDSGTNTINGGSAGAAVTLATGKSALLFKVSDTAWHSIQLD